MRAPLASAGSGRAGVLAAQAPVDPAGRERGGGCAQLREDVGSVSPPPPATFPTATVPLGPAWGPAPRQGGRGWARRRKPGGRLAAIGPPGAGPWRRRIQGLARRAV